MANIIYDTLMANTQFEQFDVRSVGDCGINNETNEIFFEYEGKRFELKVI